MHKILLVEDNEHLGFLLKEYLELNNYQVTWVKDGETASVEFQDTRFDLAIIDVMLPKKDGFSLAKEIRNIAPDSAFLFLTSKSLKTDKLKGYKLGADDYIVKPVDEEILIARIEAIIRRYHKGKDAPDSSLLYQIGNFSFNYHNQTLTLDDQTRTLTQREASLLKILCEHKNNLLGRRKALEEIWGDPDYFNRRSMDVYITKLRNYLQNDPNVQIENVHGRGFILKIDE